MYAKEIFEGGTFLTDHMAQVFLANGLDLRHFHYSHMQ